MNDQYRNRSIIIRYVFVAVIVLFIIRLGTIQFNPKYSEKSGAQSLREITEYPARGYIYDRNGELMVYNEAVFDLMIVPSETIGKRKNQQPLQLNDTAEFCRLLGITNHVYDSLFGVACHYSYVAPSIFISQIPKDEYASWQGELHKFKGFYVTRRTLRNYTRPVASHLLGYVGEVSSKHIEEDSYYRLGDYKGLSGLELYYEKELRGTKGRKVMQVDVHSRTICSYLDGKYDTVPIEGSNLYTSIDLDLQEYAERLMANKRGAIVAIEPSTGEILAMVSAPSYDPNRFVGRSLKTSYVELNRDINRPLINRAINGRYPPGSTFKVAQALAALQMGVITPNTGYACNKSLVGCHNHPSATCVREAIKMSCNPYFYNVYKAVIQQGKYSNAFADSKYGLTIWHDYMLQFGFGQTLATDLPSISRGTIPDTAYYGSIPRYKAGWKFSTIYSNSIGQGEVLLTPLQMANLACCVANRGYYITPHLVRFLGNDTLKTTNPEYSIKHQIAIDRRYFDIAVGGMYDVVHVAGGTGRRAFVEGLDVCGKTGTAQNQMGSLKRADHSAFISFAPRDNPKIALAVYVENAAGGGGSWAAPIAGLLIEKYLNGEVKRKEVEQQYLNAAPCQPMPKPKTN